MNHRGSAPLPASQPSPPSGVTALPVTRGSWLRRATTAFIAPEPTDLPGRLTIAATVAASLPSILAWLAPASAIATSPALFHLFNRLEWPLSAAILACGFMSRSRTARFLAGLTTVGLAGFFLADRIGLSGTVVSAGIWVYHAAMTSAVGVWLARTMRRWVSRPVAVADESSP